ncbi:rab-GTPase-TBC domain-containing protein [Gongronella butleri]|nr:rab-GTPase-TBC domain-containing protein [Gongronella butleri]
MASADIIQVSNVSATQNDATTLASDDKAPSSHSSPVQPAKGGRRRRGTVTAADASPTPVKLGMSLNAPKEMVAEQDEEDDNIGDNGQQQQQQPQQEPPTPQPNQAGDLENDTVSQNGHDATHEPSTDEQHQEQVVPEADDIDWDFWSQVISNYDKIAKSEPQVLLVHVQRGVPQGLRGMVWQLFARAKDVKLEQRYMQLLSETSVYEKAILRDLERTFPHHEYFQSKDGQDALFNVVKAYSLFDPETGYCQGLQFVVGPLLMNMPEEEAFSVLVKLMDKYQLKGHFTPQLTLLHQRMYQLDGLIFDQLPHLHRHFENQGIRSDMFASQWIMTLFAYKFSFDFVFRVYDLILSQGVEALLRLSLALLQKNQASLLSMDFDALLQFLKNDVLEAYKGDFSALLTDAYTINIIPKRLDRLAKDYQSESAKANSEAEAIDTLRRQNKLLTDTVKQLETNITDLDKEHSQVTTQLIETKMDIARINDENDALRQQSNDLKKALDTLPEDIELRVKDELEVLGAKNAALIQRNTALEEQLAYMEKMVVDIKVLYANSENERESLRQRVDDLKRLMGQD